MMLDFYSVLSLAYDSLTITSIEQTTPLSIESTTEKEIGRSVDDNDDGSSAIVARRLIA